MGQFKYKKIMKSKKKILTKMKTLRFQLVKKKKKTGKVFKKTT
jgi:hypothetical protein